MSDVSQKFSDFQNNKTARKSRIIRDPGTTEKPHSTSGNYQTYRVFQNVRSYVQTR
jgi:hypothetical protein